MARKRHSDEDILKLLCQIEVKLAAGSWQRRGVSVSWVSTLRAPGILKLIPDSFH